MSESLTFRSKIDTWVLVVLLGTVSVAVLAANGLRNTATVYGWIAAALVLVVGVLLPLWILTYTRYELDEHYLTVHCGPFRWAVPLKEISDVSPELSASTGPALSSSRLRLSYAGGRSLLVSPDHRELFMRSLDARRAELGTGKTAST